MVSFTASAGPRDPWQDAAKRRASVLSAESLAYALPLGNALLTRSSMAADVVAKLDESQRSSWIVQPSLVIDAPLQRADPMELVFLDEVELLPSQRLMDIHSSLASISLQASRFLPAFRDGATLYADGSAVAPGVHLGGTSPRSLASQTAARPDGATPDVSRAASLSSTTPAPVEPQIVSKPAGLPPAIAMLEAKHPSMGSDKDRGQKPGYAELIDPEDMSREQRCLAEAIYFEARSEPASGQAAVAQVVLNRVKSGLYPDTVCGVVYQNRHHYKACQFSFACEGKVLRVTEAPQWKQAVKIARDVTFGETYLPKVGNSTHYHADYVRPDWSRRFKKNDVIGRHIFYRPKPGQT